MGIVKVSIFQKSLQEGLNLTTYKKIAALKSDFLLLPEYFFADQSVKDYRSLPDKSMFAHDWLLKLNDSYKGIILGGSIIRGEGSEQFAATPVVSEGALVDYYNKRELSSEEKKLVKPGDSPGVFILGGFRFGVLLGGETKNPAYIQELAEQGIKIIFIMDTRPDFDEAEDEEQILKPAAEHGLYITRCCGTGRLFGEDIRGRSLVASPTGISWRVAPQETEQEILKTILINMVGV
ncbi:MAG: carbon-nitrogen hydrolase family protein [bacterium]|nr:carbon-nitrogen hydrolase family protein [bacterium]